MKPEDVHEPVKDEEPDHPVATAWRPTFHAIVSAFVRRDYGLAAGVPSVDRPSSEEADQFESYIRSYGETLAELPDETWSTSIAQWTGSHWDVFVDLWTAESGRSDMILDARVSEVKGGFRIAIHLVYVP